jgi:chromosome segregation ATPase
MARTSLECDSKMNTIPVGSSYDYSAPSVSLSGWQSSDYQRQFDYWSYDKQQRLDWVKNEAEKFKYELSNIEYKYNTNQTQAWELGKKRDYLKGEIYKLNTELNRASDAKTHAEARRYTVKEKERYADGSELHHLAREKEQLDSEIYRLQDVITSCQWKLNDYNSELNSATRTIESLTNENYYLKDQGMNTKYKLQELLAERDRLEREKSGC